MKRTLMLLITATVATIATADPSTDAIVSSLESATGWSREELVAGLDRLDRLYQFEMRTAEGRKRWHGRITRQIVSTNDLVKLEIHEDGFTNRVPFKIHKPSRTLKRVAITNGIPVALMAARIRRVSELNTGTTVTNITRIVNTPSGNATP